MADERTAGEGQEGTAGDGAAKQDEAQPQAVGPQEPGEHGSQELQGEPASESDAETPQPGEEAPQAVGDVPQAGADVPQAGADAPQAAGDGPQAAGDGPQAAGEAPQAAGEAPQAGGDAQRAEGEGAGPAAGEDGGQEFEDEGDEEDEEPTPRVKPEVPGLHLEVDIVPEGADPFRREESDDPYASYATDPYAEDEEQEGEGDVQSEEPSAPEPIQAAVVDLAAGARYRATGKRKTAVARVTLKPGDGQYTVNGRALEQYVPRATLQRDVRQPLEAVGLSERMDVVARVHGGGGSAQAGALRHGIARALIEADPKLRGELKQRGFLTRDARVKERKKAGLKKARKRPQFSKR